MQLEAGKKYTDRRGRVYGPLVKTFGKFFGENKETPLWDYDGRISYFDLDMDLVAEYVEPVQLEPEYRLLKDGEPFQDGDEYLDVDAKWCKAPASENRTFNPQIYFPHRRLVKPEETKAAEPVDNRVAPGDGYRLLDIGEAEQKGDQWFDRVSGQWREACLINAKINKNDLIQGYSIRRKVEPAPVESPDDWVILDPVVYAEHVPRVGIDQFQGWDDQWTTQERHHSKDAIGKWHKAAGGNHTRCRRKDLPPVPPQKPKTRTVVLKEWLCWDDDHEDVVLLRWSSADPAVDNGNLSTFDHAHATGNTRTVEIPVT